MTIEQIEIVNNIKFSIIKAIDNIESEQMWKMLEQAYEQTEKDHCEDYLKKRDKDYVHYNVKWLLDNWEQELELLSGGKIRPKGKWIQTKDDCDGVNFYDCLFECSKCGKEQSFKSSYCPIC